MPSEADILPELMSELATYDGKDAAFLRQIDGRFSETPGYANSLIELASCQMGATSDGATWLLKWCSETGRPLDRTQLDALITALPQITAWAAQLHICQCLTRLSLKDAAPGPLHDWLTPLLNHKRPFLRAWSLSALINLARHNTSLHAAASAALDRARDDPAASVQARARTLLRPGTWTHHH